MKKCGLVLCTLGLVVTTASSIVSGQERPDTETLLAAQREAMSRFVPMDGTWRGDAWTMLPSGEKHTLTQTERSGPFLAGSIRVIEGRGYESDGSIGFDALGIISYDPQTRTYSMRSYANGRVGDFVITPTKDGFQWEIPAGSLTIRYTATIQDVTWTEVGDRIAPGKDPIRFFEMTLTRLGDTGWPDSGAVAPK